MSAHDDDPILGMKRLGVDSEETALKWGLNPNSKASLLDPVF